MREVNYDNNTTYVGFVLYRKYNTCFNKGVNKENIEGASNSKWTIQRNCQHIVNKDQYKHNKEMRWLI